MCLRTLRELNPSRLIVVFGCGGDRDRAKRPLMGRVAEQGADYAIITSDNPRSEDPDGILRDVESGFQSGKYEKIVDRAAAIQRAIGTGTPARHRIDRRQGSRELPGICPSNTAFRRR